MVALRAGAPWDVEFAPFSLSQAHVEEGGTPVWDDPAKAADLLAIEAGLVVRDNFPDHFFDVHLGLFTARHDHSLDLRDESVIRDVLERRRRRRRQRCSTSWPTADLATRSARRTRPRSTDHQVFGVPTFIVGDKAAFVRVMTRPGDDAVGGPLDDRGGAGVVRRAPRAQRVQAHQHQPLTAGPASARRRRAASRSLSSTLLWPALRESACERVDLVGRPVHRPRELGRPALGDTPDLRRDLFLGARPRRRRRGRAAPSRSNMARYDGSWPYMAKILSARARAASGSSVTHTGRVTTTCGGGRPGVGRRRGDGGHDVVGHGVGAHHPRDRAVGLGTGLAQHGRAQRGHEDGRRRRGRHVERPEGVGPDHLAVERHLLPVQQAARAPRGTRACTGPACRSE